MTKTFFFDVLIIALTAFALIFIGYVAGVPDDAVTFAIGAASGVYVSFRWLRPPEK